MKLLSCIVFISSLFYIQLTEGFSSFANRSIYDKCERDVQCGPIQKCINNFCQILPKPENLEISCKSESCNWKNSECINGTCFCTKSHPKGSFIYKECMTDGSVGSYCREGLSCSWPFTSCEDNECVCPPDKPFIDHDLKRCLKVPHNYSLGLRCYNTYDCSWEKSFCEKGECRCVDGFSVKDYDQKICGRPFGNGKLGSYCDSNVECRVRYSKCVDNTCICEKSRVEDFSGQCKVPTWGEPKEVIIHCEKLSDCYKLENSNCFDGYCRCPSYYPIIQGGQCRKNATTPFYTNGQLYSPCRRDSDCYNLYSKCDFGWSGSYGTCKCKYGTRSGYGNDKCPPSGELYTSCQYNSDCYPSNSQCSYGSCECSYPETRAVNGKCKNKYSEYSYCSNNDECKTYLTCRNGMCRSSYSYSDYYSSDHLNAGAKFGIAFAVIIIVVIIALAAVGCVRKRRRAALNNRSGVIFNMPHAASTAQLVPELNSVPPGYSDVFTTPTQEPSENTLKVPKEDDNKPPASWQKVTY